MLTVKRSIAWVLSTVQFWADSGAIGGSGSQEFHVLAESGEDLIAFSTESDYAANIEKAEALAPAAECAAPTQEMTLVDTPNAKTLLNLLSSTVWLSRKLLRRYLLKHLMKLMPTSSH